MIHRLSPSVECWKHVDAGHRNSIGFQCWNHVWNVHRRGMKKPEWVQVRICDLDLTLREILDAFVQSVYRNVIETTQMPTWEARCILIMTSTQEAVTKAYGGKLELPVLQVIASRFLITKSLVCEPLWEAHTTYGAVQIAFIEDFYLERETFSRKVKKWKHLRPHHLAIYEPAD